LSTGRRLWASLAASATLAAGACASGSEIENAVGDDVPAADSVTCTDAGSVTREGESVVIHECVLRYSGGDRFDRCYVLENGAAVDVTEELAGGTESFTCAAGP